ncbi:MAG: ATP-binding protein, partial [Bacteroidetes bacterium]
MTWIARFYETRIEQMLQPGKVLWLYGSRQVGKTSLLNRVLEGRGKVFRGDGQDMVLNRLLTSLDLTQIQTAFRGYDLVFIDEAQKVEHIGQALKLLIDHEPQLQVVVSGSSSFDLSQKVGDPLTGRQKVFMLFPVSVLELTELWGGIGVMQQLENLLIYGCYPETLTAPNLESKREYLVNLRDAFLLKDILEQERVKSPAKLFDLLRLLAYQIGGEVSLNELSNQLGIAKQTVERYLDLLEKVFIIKKVQGFS